MLREVEVDHQNIVSTEEDRKDALRRQKSKYMLDKEWYCDICKTGRNYTLAGKHCHMKILKHQKNSVHQYHGRKKIDKNAEIMFHNYSSKDPMLFLDHLNSQHLNAD